MANSVRRLRHGTTPRHRQSRRAVEPGVAAERARRRDAPVASRSAAPIAAPRRESGRGSATAGPNTPPPNTICLRVEQTHEIRRRHPPELDGVVEDAHRDRIALVECSNTSRRRQVIRLDSGAARPRTRVWRPSRSRATFVRPGPDAWYSKQPQLDVAREKRPVQRQPPDRARYVRVAAQHSAVHEDAGADSSADGEEDRVTSASRPRHATFRRGCRRRGRCPR